MEQAKWTHHIPEPEQRGALWYGCYFMITPAGVTQPSRRVIESGRDTAEAAKALAKHFAKEETAKKNGEPWPIRTPEVEMIAFRNGQKV